MTGTTTGTTLGGGGEGAFTSLTGTTAGLVVGVGEAGFVVGVGLAGVGPDPPCNNREFFCKGHDIV